MRYFIITIVLVVAAALSPAFPSLTLRSSDRAVCLYIGVGAVEVYGLRIARCPLRNSRYFPLSSEITYGTAQRDAPMLPRVSTEVEWLVHLTSVIVPYWLIPVAVMFIKFAAYIVAKQGV
jgi:hypothetical protein